MFGYYCRSFNNEHIILPPTGCCGLSDGFAGCPTKAHNFYAVGLAIHPETLAKGSGVGDKHKKEIYGSIEVDGKLSKGGDRVSGWDGYGLLSTTEVFYENGGFHPLADSEFAWTRIKIIGTQSEVKE